MKISNNFQPPLSKAEAEVLGLLCEGLGPDEIAAKRFVSVGTVRTQIKTLYAKIGVRSMHAAVAMAYKFAIAERNPSEGTNQ